MLSLSGMDITDTALGLPRCTSAMRDITDTAMVLTRCMSGMRDITDSFGPCQVYV